MWGGVLSILSRPTLQGKRMAPSPNQLLILHQLHWCHKGNPAPPAVRAFYEQTPFRGVVCGSKFSDENRPLPQYESKYEEMVAQSNTRGPLLLQLLSKTYGLDLYAYHPDPLSLAALDFLLPEQLVQAQQFSNGDPCCPLKSLTIKDIYLSYSLCYQSSYVIPCLHIDATLKGDSLGKGRLTKGGLIQDRLSCAPKMLTGLFSPDQVFRGTSPLDLLGALHTMLQAALVVHFLPLDAATSKEPPLFRRQSTKALLTDPVSTELVWVAGELKGQPIAPDLRAALSYCQSYRAASLAAALAC